MEAKKKNAIHIVICVLLLIVVWGSYVVGMRKIGQMIVNVYDDDFSWVIQVDNIGSEDGKLILTGFAFKINSSSEENAFEIVLHNLDTGEYFFPKMEYTNRDDVNEYFKCEYDYSASGFFASINEEQLLLNEFDYEVLIRPKGERYAYQFSTYLSKNKLTYTNPKEYVPLDVKGTRLEEIVEDGTLRLYSPENHMYVYQYDKELYWIADKNYAFVEGDTYVEYQLYTTQIDKLPEERVKNGWFWSNIGFMFSSFEIKEYDTGLYRVSKNRIPSEYSVTRVETGKYVDSWIWCENFRPFYEFGTNSN